MITALLRAARVAWHLARGIALAVIKFPASSLAERDLLIRIWSARLLGILAIELHVSGTPPQGLAATMLVANHVSWLDIYALNAVCPARFVAKSEIADWPLLGLFARRSGTVFIERGRKRDLLRVIRELAAQMRAGVMTAVFPEGTTSEGKTVLPFRPALLQAAVACGAHLQPVAIRYERSDGTLCREAAFIDNTSFGAALWTVLGQSQIRAHLQFLPALATSGTSRKALARAAQQRIVDALESRAARVPAVPSTGETNAHQNANHDHAPA